jgi:hypothetical protein
LSIDAISESSAIVDKKFTDPSTVLVDVAVKYAHVAMLNAILEQVICTSLIAQLSSEVLPLLSVYVAFGYPERRDKDSLAIIVGIDIGICERRHFIDAFGQLVTDILNSVPDATRYRVILFLGCSFAVVTSNDENDQQQHCDK